MKPGRAEILTGLLVLVTLAVGVVFLIMVGKGALFSTGVRYHAYLQNSADLRPATPVHFEGQRVGRVVSVTWDGARRAYRITLAVPPRIPVRVDSQVRQRSVKLLGEGFMEISAGTPQAALAQPGQELEAIPIKAMTEGIDRLTKEFEPVLHEFRLALADIRRVFNPDGVLGDLEAAMESVRHAATKLDAGAGDLQTLLGDGPEGLRAVTAKVNRLLDDNGRTLGTALEDAGAAATSLRRITGDAEKPVGELVASAQRIVAELERVTGRLNDALTQVETSVADVSHSATGTLGQAQRLLRDNEADIRAAILATRAATENLKRAAAKVADRPSTLLFDSEDETSKAARERRDFERLLRERGRANRYGKE